MIFRERYTRYTSFANITLRARGVGNTDVSKCALHVRGERFDCCESEKIEVNENTRDKETRGGKKRTYVTRMLYVAK